MSLARLRVLVLPLCAVVALSVAASCSSVDDPIRTVTDAGHATDGGSDDAGSTMDGGKSDAGKGDAGNNQQDAGNEEGDGGDVVLPAACGGVSELGDCQGDVAEWCDTDYEEVSSVDCANDVGGSCAVLPNWGSWCAMGQGSPCYIEGSLFACGNRNGASANLACDIDNGCVARSGTCDPETFAPSCDGNTLLGDCSAWGQLIVVQCDGDTTGGTGCSAGACTGIPAGAYCDDQIFKCATGLICVDNACG